MLPEAKTKKKITAVLKSHGAYSYMPVSNGMGAAALDFIVCFRGRFISIEAKAWDSNKQMTDRQKHTTHKIRDAGGICFLVRDDETLQVLDNWLTAIHLCGDFDL